MIERTIHQIWHPFSSPDIPRNWERLQRSWRRLHPGHTYRLWGVDESRAFVAALYPGFLPTYDAYRNPIQRVDSLRILLLHHFGGIYVDLDIECLRNVEELLEGKELVLAAEPELHSRLWSQKGYRQIVSTAFMASEADHPFWPAVIAELKRSSGVPDVMDSTGRFVVTRCFERYGDRTGVTLAAPDLFYPIDEPECRDQTAYDLEYWLRTTASAFGIHHWASTWNRPGASSRPATRPYDLGLPMKLRDPVLASASRPSQLLDDGPLVTCVMVTRGWTHPARWSIASFLNQTYRNRELVIVTTNPDGDLAEHLRGVGDPRIRVTSALSPGTPLGAQRNFAVDQARGELICTWDDDDLFGADRLAAGVTALRASNAAAAFLERITLWWPIRQQLVASARHPWENTMIAQRKLLPRYPEVERSEDSTVVAEVIRRHPTVTVDDPNLFVHVINGGNTWGPDHFEPRFQRATVHARGAAYDRALSLMNKHVPILEYLEWLQDRDPKTFLPPADAAAQLSAIAPEARAMPARIVRPRPRPAPSVPRRFLFAWEIGAGLGHSVRLSQIADPLLEAGHEVHLALLDLSSSRAALGRLAAHPRLRLWQAPHWPSLEKGFVEPACYAELLFRVGYLDARRLTGVVDGWDTLFRNIQPDLLLADHAPTALLAARGHAFRRALVGSGFFLPIGEKPMESLRDWEPIPRSRIEKAEESVLETCNAILAARRLPAMAQLADLLAVDERFLTTVPELDHFERRGRDPSQTYYGSLPPAAHGQPARWPQGTEPAVFAYLKSDYGPVRQILTALRAGPWRVLAYVPGLSHGAVAELSSPRMSVVTEPIDMSDVCATCDAIVCQSGSGTVATALHAGKPLVVLPMHVEQFLIARRVRSLGAGLFLLENQTERFSEFLRRVLTEPGFRDAARAFARRYADVQAHRVTESIALRCQELAESPEATSGGAPCGTQPPGRANGLDLSIAPLPQPALAEHIARS